MMFYLIKLAHLALLLSTFYSYILSEEKNIPTLPQEYSYADSNKDFDFDNVTFDEEDNYQFMNEYLDVSDMDHISRAINPVEIMVILNLLEVPLLLQEPLFLHTNFLNKRSLLDQPIFEPDRAEFPGKWVIGTNTFIRKTTRSNFTSSSTRLDSWLALSQASLIAKLEKTIANVNMLAPGTSIEIAKILSLFENMTVEERQVGFMIHGMKRWKNVTLRIMAPLYYLESNFSLTKTELDEVARVLGVMEPEQEKRFRKAHFISDKIGMGDTRIEVDGTVLQRPSLTLRCGGLATIPTAFTWGGNFLGSSFARPSTLPTFDLEPILDSLIGNSSEEEAMTLLTNFALDAFDRIAADLIDVPLGNRGHLGIGAYMRAKLPVDAYINTWFAERLKFAGRTSLELFMPAREKRFYINKIDLQGFGDHNFNDFDLAAENLQFLKEQAISRLFLRAFSTRVIPGIIFRWNGGMYYKGELFGFNIGLDYWLQNKARLSSIHASPRALSEIDIPKAKQPVAQQSKIFGAFVFKHKTDKSTWIFSLNADASLTTKGLGQDYSLAFNFEASF